VRSQAHVGLRHRERLAAEVGALDHVPQLVAHVQTAVGQARDRAADQRVGAAAAPLGHRRLRRLLDHARRVEQAEQTAALEVGAHDLAGHAERRRRRLLAAKTRHRDRDLGRPDAADLDPELRPRAGHRHRGKGRAKASAIGSGHSCFHRGARGL
jgi:hypothetical protein